MQFTNKITGESINVSNLTIKDGRIFFSVRGKGCGARFFNRNVCVVMDEQVSDGTFLKCAEGWELVATPRKKKTANKQAEPVAAEPVAEPVEQAEDDTTNEQALIAAIKNLRGGAVHLASVRRIVAEELAKYAQQQPQKAAKLAVVAAKNGGKKEYYCKGFKDILEDVADGFYPYLYGAAGCGKSHTAEQVAEKLGLDYYSQTTIQFAHDVKGYGDAGGNYQDTPFYKAFAFGGLYFQDEIDRSQADALIVLNTALANGYYDFPVIGRVEMHPNFRFMGAGNTLMKGAENGYITGNELDPSSRDRFATYYEIGYSHEVELNAIADGDEVLVDFIEQVRRAIKSCNIEHVCSYRATKYMAARKDRNKAAVLKRSTFKGLEVDAIREIYSCLPDKSNPWAEAMRTLF